MSHKYLISPSAKSPSSISPSAISPNGILLIATSPDAIESGDVADKFTIKKTPERYSPINIRQLHIPRRRQKVVPKIFSEDEPRSAVSIEDNGQPSTPYTISSIILPDYYKNYEKCSDKIIRKHDNEKHIDIIDNLIKSRALLDIFYRIKSVSQNSYHTIDEITFIKKIQTIIKDIECQLKKIFSIFNEKNYEKNNECENDDITCILNYFLNNFDIDKYLKEQILKEYNNALTKIQQQKNNSVVIGLSNIKLNLNIENSIKSYIDVLIKLKLIFIYHPNINLIKVIINFLLLSNNFIHPKILTLFKQINKSSTVGGNFYKRMRAMIGLKSKEEIKFSNLDESMDESIDENMKDDTIEILDDIICACYQKYYRLHYNLVYELDSKKINSILSEIGIDLLHQENATTIDEIYKYEKYIGLLEMIKIYITTCEKFIIISEDDFNIIKLIFSKSSFDNTLKDLIDIYNSFILNQDKCLSEILEFCDNGYQKNFNKEINDLAEFLIKESDNTIYNFNKKIKQNKINTETDEIKIQCNDGYDVIEDDNLFNDESKLCYCSNYGTVNNDCNKCMFCRSTSKRYIIFICNNVMCFTCVFETIRKDPRNKMFTCVCGEIHYLP